MNKFAEQLEKVVRNVCDGNMTVFEAGVAEIIVSFLFVLGAIQNIFGAVVVTLTAIVLAVIGTVTVMVSPICMLVKWLKK